MPNITAHFKITLYYPSDYYNYVEKYKTLQEM